MDFGSTVYGLEVLRFSSSGGGCSSVWLRLQVSQFRRIGLNHAVYVESRSQAPLRTSRLQRSGVLWRRRRSGYRRLGFGGTQEWRKGLRDSGKEYGDYYLGFRVFRVYGLGFFWTRDGEIGFRVWGLGFVELKRNGKDAARYSVV